MLWPKTHGFIGAVLLGLMLAGFSPARAQAEGLLLNAPGVVANAGIGDLADAWFKKTGVKVTIKTLPMARIMGDTETATPAADITIMPLDFVASLALNHGVVAGSFKPLGRVEIGLGVKAGAPHPDISTVAKLAAVLKGAKNITRSNPVGTGPRQGSMEARIIDELLKRPEFAGVRSTPTSNGDGSDALIRGEGDMTLQLVCEILNRPEVSLVGPLPPELGAHIDTGVAISARSSNAKAAADFIAYITSPEAAAIWKAKGLNRY